MATQDELPANLTFSVTSLGDDGYPALVDTAFNAAIAASQEGGAPTQSFFDALNRTSDFWTLVADGAIGFAPGTDPSGRPVLLASSGNVDFRAAVVAVSNLPGVDAVLRLSTRNTTTGVTQMLSFGLVASTPLQAGAIQTLAPAIYQGVQTLLTQLASQLAAQSRVEGPEVDATSVVAAVVSEVSAIAIRAVGNTVLHIDWMAVQWSTQIAGSLAALSVLVAIPLVIEFMGHTMSHSLIVQNLTDTAFACTPTLEAGSYSVKPSSSALPAQSVQPDPFGPQASDVLSHAVAMQTASSEFGSIGLVLDLLAASGDSARLLVGIPWAGHNTVWAGPATGSPDDAWQQHSSQPSTGTTASTTFGPYKVTLSINRLSGETGGAYFYCSTAVIQAA